MSDACINLRGDTNDADFADAARDVLGQDLPTEPNTTSRGDHCVYWLGPDEWLVTTTAERRVDVLGKLEGALSSMHSAVNDTSGGNIVLRLSGDDATDVLAQGCTLDLDDFAVGDCAQTGLGKAGVLIGRDAETEFTIIVRRSFADYLLKWLKHASRGRGIEFR